MSQTGVFEVILFTASIEMGETIVFATEDMRRLTVGNTSYVVQSLKTSSWFYLCWSITANSFTASF